MFFHTALLLLGCVVLVQGGGVRCKDVESCAAKALTRGGGAGGVRGGSLPFGPGFGGIASGSPRTQDKYTYLASDATQGWVDLPKSKFHRFHLYLQLSVTATIPTWTVQPRTMSWGCADQVIDFATWQVHTIQTCTAFVFVYGCGGCASEGRADLVSALVANDWELVECAGYFRLDYEGGSFDHRLSVFYREFPASRDSRTTLRVDINKETEFIFWGQVHRDTVMCGQQPTEDACSTGRTREDCFWDDAEAVCKPKVCSTISRTHKPWAVGPGHPMCHKCPHDEDDLIKNQ